MIPQTLYDALTAGTLLVSMPVLEDVTVTGGLFAVTLDFGAGVFAGSRRWVEIGVRPGASTDAFTSLVPRQELAPTPQAVYATKAGEAATLGGQPAASFLGTGTVIDVAHGGTGAATQNFVDLSTAQTVGGNKTFTGKLAATGNAGVVLEGTLGSGTIPASGSGPRMMWYPGKGAFRAGVVFGTQWDDASVGTISAAMGVGTTASGPYTLASGNNTTASGNSSTASGSMTTASGSASAAMGVGTTAQGFATLALGQYNVVAGDQLNWVATDPLFVAGNGSSSAARSNALTLLKNGDLSIAGRLTVSGTDGALFGGTDGLGTIPATGAGVRFMWYPAKAALRAGRVTGTEWDDASVGLSSTAMGYALRASGHYATAFGVGAVASGYASVAIGDAVKALGSRSAAFGEQSEASGPASTAMGGSTRAVGYDASSMGYRTTAQAYASLAMGRYNVIAGDSATWVDTDPVFVVGNGTSAAAPSNALTLLKNGNLGLGTVAPGNLLTVNGKASFGGSAAIDFEPLEVQGAYAGVSLHDRLGGAAERWVIYSNRSGTGAGTPGTQTLKFWNGYADLVTISAAGNLTALGCVTGNNIACVSDARLKVHVASLRYGLADVLRLRPVSWTWKDPARTEATIGLIAQEVEPVIPELVLHDVDAAGSLGLNYVGFVPVVIKAIQEQQVSLAQDEHAIQRLTQALTDRDATTAALRVQVDELQRRLAAIESLVQALVTTAGRK